MRVSQDEMDENHRKIVEGAARLVRDQGFERPSVADFMREAGLTHGGFYRHFETKDALVVAAIEAAFEQFGSALEERFERQEPANAVAGYRADYLSDQHVARAGDGCPLAALGGDVARGSAVLKAAFGAGLRRAVAALARGMPGSRQGRRDRALREIAMLAGAVMLARASDDQTAQAVLSACRGGVRTPASATRGRPARDR